MIFQTNEQLIAVVRESKDEIISILRQRIVWLEAELKRERQRADLAVDQLLQNRQQKSVMPEKVVFPQPLEIKEGEIEQIRNELEKIGSIEDYGKR